MDLSKQMSVNMALYGFLKRILNFFKNCKLRKLCKTLTTFHTLKSYFGCHHNNIELASKFQVLTIFCESKMIQFRGRTNTK